MSHEVIYSRHALADFRRWLYERTGNPKMLEMTRNDALLLKSLNTYFSQDARVTLAVAERGFTTKVTPGSIFDHLESIIDSLAREMLSDDDYQTYRQALKSQQDYAVYVEAGKPIERALSWTLLYALLTGKHNAVAEIANADYFGLVGYYRPGVFSPEVLDYVDTNGTLPFSWWINLRGGGDTGAQ